MCGGILNIPLHSVNHWLLAWYNLGFNWIVGSEHLEKSFKILWNPSCRLLDLINIVICGQHTVRLTISDHQKKRNENSKNKFCDEK